MNENERLRGALRAIVAVNLETMYQRCPDCYDSRCDDTRVCRVARLSREGQIAEAALAETPMENCCGGKNG